MKKNKYDWEQEYSKETDKTGKEETLSVKFNCLVSTKGETTYIYTK